MVKAITTLEANFILSLFQKIRPLSYLSLEAYSELNHKISFCIWLRLFNNFEATPSIFRFPNASDSAAPPREFIQLPSANS